MDKLDRPILNTKITIEDFNDYYWLKVELTNFCREVGICSVGSKMELTKRIQQFLENGTIIFENNKITYSSDFDWNKEQLSTSTIITDNYKNTENVRTFFCKEIGKSFKFNVAFMKWMKTNSGKTLGDAIKQWNEIKTLKSNNNFKTEIASQFEYNAYIKDFFVDNPHLSINDAIACWNKKRKQKGDKKYIKDDLKLIN